MIVGVELFLLSRQRGIFGFERVYGRELLKPQLVKILLCRLVRGDVVTMPGEVFFRVTGLAVGGINIAGFAVNADMFLQGGNFFQASVNAMYAGVDIIEIILRLLCLFPELFNIIKPVLL